MSNSCFILAGEKSGEEHALSFFHELKSQCPDVDFFGVGGDQLKKEGLDLLYHLKDFSSFGFSEVLGLIPFYYRAMNNIVHEIEKRHCKVAILIDFQDFNLRLAKRLKKRGVKVLYFVAPQAWAWKSYRAKILAKTVHTLFTIIPFEKEWFSSRGVQNVIGIKHPLLPTYEKDIVSKKLDLNAKPFDRMKEGTRILLLPGSRNFEVINLLPIFTSCIRKLKESHNIEVGIVTSSSVRHSAYAPYIDQISEFFTDVNLKDALNWADLAYAASGTVTLATALFQVPTVVAYKSSYLNYFIYDLVINYKGAISLANIVHDKVVFPEFIQDRATPYNLRKALEIWLTDRLEYEKIKNELVHTAKLLSGDDISVPNYIAGIVNQQEIST